MKKILIILILVIGLTSCGKTIEEIKKEKTDCEGLGNIYRFWGAPFGGYSSSCNYSGHKTITDIEREQIDFCNSQGLSYKSSAWDGMIKCVPIE